MRPFIESDTQLLYAIQNNSEAMRDTFVNFGSIRVPEKYGFILQGYEHRLKRNHDRVQNSDPR